jgi:hypothetical protein
MIDPIEAVERRRRLLRGVLLAIIIGTIPFYCLGFWLWGTAPQAGGNENTPAPTNTAIGGGTPSRTPTSLFTTTPLPTLTPPQIPTSSGGGGGGFPPQPTAVFPTAFIPSPTTAPSFTPFPSATPFVPSATPFPTLTWTPLPPATNTLPPTLTPTIFVLPTSTSGALPTNTPPGSGEVPTQPVTIVFVTVQP